MTLTTERTLGEIAAGNPGAVRVFEKHQLDYCCGGDRPIEQACREKGLSVKQLLREVEQAAATEPPQDWTGRSLAELIDHIVSTHHAYLKAELPALEARIAKVLEAHGAAHSSSLVPLGHTFADMKAELSAHMMKEEMILFPLIKQMEAGTHYGSVSAPIRVMEYEHDSAATALREMRRLTSDYSLPPDACHTYRALFGGLRALEIDLHLHIHLENNILFPRAAELEEKLP